jgi:hypothetical protein
VSRKVGFFNVLDGGNEQSVAIKFCFKAGLSATETPVLVQKACGNEALNRSKVFRWYVAERFSSVFGAEATFCWPRIERQLRG